MAHQPPIADTLRSEMRHERAAEARRELDAMREARRESDRGCDIPKDAPYCLHALNYRGEVLYETEPAWTKEAAEDTLSACKNLLEKGNFDDEVDDFVIHKRF